MNPKKTDRAMAHNQYSVKDTTRHYIWGEPSKEETLVDKVCAGAAFVACIVVLMFMG
jgi:hypothetical protein